MHKQQLIIRKSILPATMNAVSFQANAETAMLQCKLFNIPECQTYLRLD